MHYVFGIGSSLPLARALSRIAYTSQARCAPHARVVRARACPAPAVLSPPALRCLVHSSPARVAALYARAARGVYLVMELDLARSRNTTVSHAHTTLLPHPTAREADKFPVAHFTRGTPGRSRFPSLHHGLGFGAARLRRGDVSHRDELDELALEAALISGLDLEG